MELFTTGLTFRQRIGFHVAMLKSPRYARAMRAADGIVAQDIAVE